MCLEPLRELLCNSFQPAAALGHAPSLLACEATGCPNRNVYACDSSCLREASIGTALVNHGMKVVQQYFMYTNYRIGSGSIVLDLDDRE